MDAVAILSCRKAAETCGGVDCLGFFHRRERSFSGRGDREMSLAAFATCNGCECDPASDEAFQKKLDKLSGAGVEEVHVAACVTGEKRACPRKEAILTALSARGPIVYTAAKGAVRSVSKILAKQFGPLGVRVNTIYPGFIVTEMTEKIHEMPEQEKRMREESPLGLLGKAEDIGYCALYLASDAAKFVTGQDFVIDGGATC